MSFVGWIGKCKFLFAQLASRSSPGLALALSSFVIFHQSYQNVIVYGRVRLDDQNAPTDSPSVFQGYVSCSRLLSFSMKDAGVLVCQIIVRSRTGMVTRRNTYSELPDASSPCQRSYEMPGLKNHPNMENRSTEGIRTGLT